MLESAIFGYLLVGFILGVAVGAFSAAMFAVGNPIVLEHWERYRMAKDSRKQVNEALSEIKRIFAEKA